MRNHLWDISQFLNDFEWQVYNFSSALIALISEIAIKAYLRKRVWQFVLSFIIASQHRTARIS
jgi:hypothetical protein